MLSGLYYLSSISHKIKQKNKKAVQIRPKIKLIFSLLDKKLP